MSVAKIQIHDNDGGIDTYENNFFAYIDVDKENHAVVQKCSGLTLTIGCATLLAESVRFLRHADIDAALALVDDICNDIAMLAKGVVAAQFAEEGSPNA